MSSSCTIAIVGGGLAGLAAAHALRTFGMQAEVFEAAPALGEIGAAVNVSPQAFKALQAIDLGDKVAAIGTASPGMSDTSRWRLSSAHWPISPSPSCTICGCGLLLSWA